MQLNYVHYFCRPVYTVLLICTLHCLLMSTMHFTDQNVGMRFDCCCILVILMMIAVLIWCWIVYVDFSVFQLDEHYIYWPSCCALCYCLHMYFLLFLLIFLTTNALTVCGHRCLLCNLSCNRWSGAGSVRTVEIFSYLINVLKHFICPAA